MKFGIFQLIREDEKPFGLANILTLSRLIFLPFVVYFLLLRTREGDLYALLFMGLSCLTDYFDGIVARKYGEQTHLGRMLDPVVDKLSVGIVMLVLSVAKGLPYWYTSFVIGRDVFLLIASVVLIARHRTVVASNQLGKWTVGMFAMVIITFTINLPFFKWMFMWMSVILIPVTIVNYVLSHKHSIKEGAIVNVGAKSMLKKSVEQA